MITIDIQDKILGLQCPKCGYFTEKYAQFEKICPNCESPMHIKYNYEKLARTFKKTDLKNRETSMLRYIEFLPLDKNDIEILPSLGEGWTPIINLKSFAKKVGGSKLFGKNEYVNPTGSFVDRGVMLETFFAIQHNKREIATISPGNLGVSVSAYAHKANLRSTVIVSDKIEIGKLYQILAFGSEIRSARDYENAKFELLKNNLIHLVETDNLFYNEGLKTIAFELLEQLKWEQPNFILIPTGSGSLYHSISRGISELSKIGFIEDVSVKLVSIQISECYESKHSDKGESEILQGNTNKIGFIVDLCPKNPTHLNLVKMHVSEGQGFIFRLSEREIMQKINFVIQQTGLLLEPASITTLVAYEHLVNDGKIDPSDRVVAILTGGGLKNLFFLRNLHQKNKMLLEISLENFLLRYNKGEIGETKRIILKIIKKYGPLHGFAILKKLKLFGIEITTATLYQHLKELEKSGYITVYSVENVGGRKRKNYILTEIGEEKVDKT